MESFKNRVDFLKKMETARSKTSRLEHCLAFYLQRVLKNGFVVFKKDYPVRVERHLPTLVETGGSDFIGWQTAMEVILEDYLPK
jgi:hypothetical protein